VEKATQAYSALVQLILNSLPNLSTHDANRFGIKNELFERLKHLRPNEHVYLLEHASRFLTISFDASSIEQLLNEAQEKNRERELEDQFLYSQATNTMMRELFGMHTTEFCARRRVLGLAGQGQHRPQYCDEETEILIWRQWKKYESLEERQRYLSVAEAACQPLNIVWPAIKRHLL